MNNAKYKPGMISNIFNKEHRRICNKISKCTKLPFKKVEQIFENIVKEALSITTDPTEASNDLISKH